MAGRSLGKFIGMCVRLLVRESLVDSHAYVFVSPVGDDGDNLAARVGGGDLDSLGDVASRGDTYEESLLAGGPLGHGDGVVPLDGIELDQVLQQVAGDEVGADALDLVGSGLTVGDECGLGGFHGDDLCR